MGYRFDSFDPDGELLAAEEQDDGSYWGRHWRGHLPLAQTYWLNGFLTNMVIAGLGLAFMALEHTGRSLRLISVGFLLYVMLALIARGWSLVGRWRSAGRHAARGGTPGWGTVARVMVVFGLLATLGQMPSLALQAKEYGLIAVGRDPMGPLAAITLDESGKSLEVKGPLSAGVADRFEEVLNSAPGTRTIMLDSDGGRIFEALRMAELIRARGLDTRVERNCASACTLILLAGKDRSAHRFAQIGFHQPDFPGLSEAEKNGISGGNVVPDPCRHGRCRGADERRNHRRFFGFRQEAAGRVAVADGERCEVGGRTNGRRIDPPRRGGTVRIKAGHPPLADKAVQHVGGETIAGKSTGEHHGRNLQQPAKKHDRYGGKLRL